MANLQDIIAERQKLMSSGTFKGTEQEAMVQARKNLVPQTSSSTNQSSTQQNPVNTAQNVDTTPLSTQTPPQQVQGENFREQTL